VCKVNCQNSGTEDSCPRLPATRFVPSISMSWHAVISLACVGDLRTTIGEH
jgi:hypothetical protein